WRRFLKAACMYLFDAVRMSSQSKYCRAFLGYGAACSSASCVLEGLCKIRIFTFNAWGAKAAHYKARGGWSHDLDANNVSSHFSQRRREVGHPRGHRVRRHLDTALRTQSKTGHRNDFIIRSCAEAKTLRDSGE